MQRILTVSAMLSKVYHIIRCIEFRGSCQLFSVMCNLTGSLTWSWKCSLQQKKIILDLSQQFCITRSMTFSFWQPIKCCYRIQGPIGKPEINIKIWRPHPPYFDSIADLSPVNLVLISTMVLNVGRDGKLGACKSLNIISKS